MTARRVLSAEAVWKEYTRRGAGAQTLKQLFLHPRLPRDRDRFWALQDVNLRLDRGDTVGLIGANGSGKSTFLRLIGGLGRPTRGRIERQCSVGAMMSLGESFDPLLTGRENALTAGILAGYTHKQAAGKLDEIVAFAELEEFFDLPIRMYSDGMSVRLAFSVAISTEPELMLIDEVLSVGDLRFQEKCFDRLAEMQGRGTTILLASHDEDQIARLCSRVLWLAHGRVQAQGSPDEVYAHYRETMRVETERRSMVGPRSENENDDVLRPGENRFGTLEVEIAGVRVDPAKAQRSSAERGTAIGVEIDLAPKAAVEDPIVGVSLRRVSDGTVVLDVSTAADGVRLGPLQAPTTIALQLDRLDVEPGLYRFDVGVYECDWAYVYDYHWQAYPIELYGGGGKGFGPPRRWLLPNKTR